MSNRIVVGYWDCTYCDSKHISGLEKHCPSCGNPQSKDVKFYMDKAHIEYLDDERASNYGKGADWICEYCGSYNHYDNIICSNCGSNKSEAKEDYFGNQINPELENKTNSSYSEPINQDATFEPKEEKKYSPINQYLKNLNRKKLFSFLGIGAAVIGLLILLIAIFSPKEYNATVTSNSWERTITIQEYRWVEDDSWYSAPSGARNITSRSEIYTYDEVLDHYENVQVQKSRQVFDHTEYEVHTYYSDNGDGTFTEHSYTTSHDVYRTEYYYETEQKPVYKSVPRYELHYYYEIQKWVYDRTEKLSKSNDYSPSWPEYSLKENERVSSKEEKYLIVFKTSKKNYSANVPQSYLTKFKIGSKVKITVVAGFVSKINGEKIK